MDNPEKLATLGTQDIRGRQANQNTHHDTQTSTNTCSITKKTIRRHSLRENAKLQSQ
jgi:hypothetical protein